MKHVSARKGLSVFVLAMLVSGTATAQFSTPYRFPGNPATMGGLTHPTSGPDSLAVWFDPSSAQAYFASKTAGTWTSPQAIQNVVDPAPCCAALRADGSGKAMVAYSNPGAGVFYADFGNAAWSAPGAISPP